MQPIAHRQAWDLIPWLVNDSIDAGERRRVEEHLRDCADCRDEFAFQHRLRAGMAAHAGVAHAPQPALRRLLSRIDAEDTHALQAGTAPQARPDRRLQRGGMRRRTRWLAAAAVAQSIGLVVLGALLFARDHMPAADAPASDAPYATLTRGDVRPPAAAIRFVPSPTLTLGALQSILGDAHVRLVESNAGGTIYALALDDTTDAPAAGTTQRIETVLARLRAQPGVLLAEPIARGTEAR
ncbi:MAG: zf-HC2 domain-containing protein [Lysobacterales bacterium]